MGVFHEEAAHQIFLISESLGMDAARIQQKSWRFEAARGEHVGASPDEAPAAL